MVPSEEPTYWQGKMDAKIESINETLRLMELGQLRRHEENKERLETVEQEIRDLEKWRAYVKGVAVAWSVGASFAFALLSELFHFAIGKGHGP